MQITHRRRSMHYTRRIDKLGNAIALIAPYAYEGNGVMKAIELITDIQDDLWSRHNFIDPDKPTTFSRFKRHLARRRAITVAMIKEQSND